MFAKSLFNSKNIKKTILSFMVLCFVSVAALASVYLNSSSNFDAEAISVNKSKSNTKDSWLAITNSTSSNVEGYFCAKRTKWIGKDEELKIRVFLDGKTVVNETKTSYNSMSPFARNCDKGDRNKFNYPFTYTNDCRYKDIQIEVQTTVNGQTNSVINFVNNPFCVNKQAPTPSTRVNPPKVENPSIKNPTQNPVVKNPTNKTDNKPKNTVPPVVENKYSGLYLTASTCSNLLNNKVSFYLSSSKSSVPCSGGVGLYGKNETTTKLDNRYLNVSVCQDAYSISSFDYYVVLNSQLTSANVNQCTKFSDTKAIDFYSLDLLNASNIIIEQCEDRNNKNNTFPNVYTNRSSSVYKNCSPYKNTKVASIEILKLDMFIK